MFCFILEVSKFMNCPSSSNKLCINNMPFFQYIVYEMCCVFLLLAFLSISILLLYQILKLSMLSLLKKFFFLKQ